MMESSGDLQQFITSMGSERALRVEETYGGGFVRLNVSEAERRQAKHDIQSVEDIIIELLRNARDARATRIYLATQRDGDLRYVCMLDDGIGIPETMHKKIFEPRVTSKLDTMHMDRWGVHGRGMALFSIYENTKESCVAYSQEGKGASFSLTIDLNELNERSDQSSWPKIIHDSHANAISLTGPKNIIRTCCEFSIEEHNDVKVYIGSFSEIVASIRHYTKVPVHSKDLDELSCLEQLAYACDAQELYEIANSFGLKISRRNAHRILSGEIPAQKSVYSSLSTKNVPQIKAVDLTKDMRGLKLAPSDLQAFTQSLEEDFTNLGDKYYLNLTSTPKVSIRKNKITVVFEIEEKD